MQLRTKLALLLTAVMATYGLGASVVMYSLLGSRFVEFEQREAENDVRRVIDLLDEHLTRMSDYSFELSAWDATHEFVNSPNDAYLVDDLGADEPAVMGYHLLYIIDTEGRVAWHLAYNPSMQVPLEFAAFPSDQWPRDHLFLQHDDAYSEVSGFIVTEHGILCVSARPIVHSNLTGPIAGTLVMATHMLPEDFERLSTLARIPFTVTPIPADAPQSGAGVSVAGRTSDTLHFQTTYPDVFGAHRFLLDITSPREISLWGYSVIQWAIVMLLGAASLALVTVGFLVTRMVIRPLVGLQEHVTAIAHSDDLGAPLVMDRNDEIGQLAGEFNAMADRIQRQHDLRREAESAVRHSEARLRAIFDSAADGVILVNEQLRIESANPAAQRMYGWTEDEMRGMSAAYLLDGSTDDVRAQFKAIFERVSVHHSIAMGRESVGRRKDGSTFPVHFAVSEVEFEEGTLFLAIVRDITEMHSIHEEMSRTQHLAALGEMGASVAHEVRNPIAGISGAVQVLRQYFQSGDSAFEMLNEIQHNVQRVEKTVRALLLFSRRWHANVQEVDLREVIADARRTVELDNRYPACSVEVQISNTARTVADPQLIEHVLANLLGNAAEAASPGGLVRLSVETTDTETRVIVDDNGPGIPPELRDTVFRPFYTTKTAGTGLGLGICRQMMDAHGGGIEVRTSPLGGARFVLRVPNAAHRAPETAPAESDTHSQSGTRKDTP